MKRSARGIIATTAVVAGLGIVGVAAVSASSGDETETPITGSALQQASAAALAETGEGRVTSTEVGDEESYYQVEVTLNDGSQVDVQLDKNFNVVGSKTDQGEKSGNDGS